MAAPVVAALVTAACGSAGTGAAAAPVGAAQAQSAGAAGAQQAPATAASPSAARKPAATGKADRNAAAKPAKKKKAAKKPAAAAVGTTAATVAACDKVAKAKLSTGPAPVQYAKGWTPAPTKGCKFTDKFGRTVTLTAAQNRMLFRVNEMRKVQNAKDGKKRPMLYPDFCLMELAQGYANTKPMGHNPLLTKMYPWRNGNFSGTYWIQENYGNSGGFTTNPLLTVDQRIYGWFTSGSLKTGHYGTMMNPVWGYGGAGLFQQGSLFVGIQTFSNSPAMYTYSSGKKCSKPPKPLSKNSTVPPIGNPPNQIQR